MRVRTPPSVSVKTSPGKHLAQVACPDQVERARLTRHAVRGGPGLVLDHPEHQRTQSVRIAEGDHRLLGQHDGRERPAETWQHVGHGVLDLLGGMARQQRRDDLGIGRRAERHVALAQLGVELDGVDQVAVVGQGERAAVVADDRLGVLPLRGAGGRVADVADRHVTDQGAELVLVEDLGDQALVADGHDLAPPESARDPGRLLAPVLERKQTKVCDAGDVVSRRVDAEDTALVARAIAMVGHRRTHAQPAAKASSGTRPIRSDRRPGPPAARTPQPRAGPRYSTHPLRPRRS